MSSGGGKNTTTVQKSDPPAWAVPYFQQALGKANNIANQPYIGYGGPRISDFTDDQYAGFDMVRQQAAAGRPTMDAANRYIGNQLSGRNAFQVQRNPYAGKNPYLDQMIGDAQSDVVDSYSKTTVPSLLGQFNAGGAFGGTAMQEALADSQGALAGQLGRISTGMRSEDYNRQVNLAESDLARRQSAWGQNQANSLSAIGQIGGLNDAKYDDARALMNIGQQQQNLNNQIFDIGYNDFREWRDWDANRLGILTNALGAIQGGQSSSTGPNPNYRSAGENAATAAMLMAALWG